MRFILFALYLGVGALLHAAVIGPHFDWSSAWTFGWLFGWPIMVLITFWAIGLACLIGGALAYCGYWWLDKFAHWRAGRKQRAP